MLLCSGLGEVERGTGEQRMYTEQDQATVITTGMSGWQMRSKITYNFPLQIWRSPQNEGIRIVCWGMQR